MNDIKVEHVVLPNVACARVSDLLYMIVVCLRKEGSFWFKKDPSETANIIHEYMAAFELLIAFALEGDLTSFVLVFSKYKISVVGIRRCFRNGSGGTDVKTNRNQAYQSFAEVCRIVRANLMKQPIKAEARMLKISDLEAIAYFEGQIVDAEKSIESDVPPMGIFG
jgi:hypothetical protein